MKPTEGAILCVVLLVAIVLGSGKVTKKPSNMSKRLTKKQLYRKEGEKLSKKSLNISARVTKKPLNMMGYDRVSTKPLNMSETDKMTTMPLNTSSQDTTTESIFYMYDGAVGLSNKSITAEEYAKWMEEYEYEEPDCKKPGNMCEYVGYHPDNGMFHEQWAKRSTWNDPIVPSLSSGMAVKEPEKPEGAPAGEPSASGNIPYNKSCCTPSHITKCPFKSMIKRVGRVFTPHFWKRKYHKIMYDEDIGPCDPNDCRCATVDDQHNCEKLGHQCPCTQHKASKK
ncbi:hypothetical protein WDU94_008552 [Cyamophila willieti]